ncbi:hypothetical protein [Antiquaquibacter soli]|uniref:HNH endonuclease n=1 Tax=Antiquaquibacter soli TaxID=3064523 RepID=A0ABT9BKP4_9MICO|nr:hypothetical protein [Protaetiibacter sp. WY-16]MDO7881003.1 hypothetical protein [Protaetiibacter sp. WY-16]
MTSITTRLAAAVIACVAVPALLAGCTGPTTTTDVGEPVVASDSWSESTTGSAPGAGSCELDHGDEGTRPDASCTPGAVTSEISPADPSVVCRESAGGEINESVRSAVLSAYGIENEDAPRYRVDYLVPRQLGGANDFANLWPMPESDPSATTKAQTDAAVADAVCGGRAGIQAAQYAIAHNWTTALTVLGLGG